MPPGLEETVPPGLWDRNVTMLVEGHPPPAERTKGQGKLGASSFYRELILNAVLTPGSAPHLLQPEVPNADPGLGPAKLLFK